MLQLQKTLSRHIVRYRDLASAGQTHCIHYCMGCCGRQTSHYDVNAVFVNLCMCER